MSDSKPEANPSIMPLVEENRQLHARVRFLEKELEAQKVQWDQWMESNPVFKMGVGQGVQTIDVEVDHAMMLLDREEMQRETMKRLVGQLVYKVQPLQVPDFKAALRSHFRYFVVGQRRR